jgi:hypothetical protein
MKRDEKVAWKSPIVVPRSIVLRVPLQKKKKKKRNAAVDWNGIRTHSQCNDSNYHDPGISHAPMTVTETGNGNPRVIIVSGTS